MVSNSRNDPVVLEIQNSILKKIFRKTEKKGIDFLSFVHYNVFLHETVVSLIHVAEEV